MFAVGGGGPRLVRPPLDFDFEDMTEFARWRGAVFGLGAAPPYFSSNCCVELYLVAAFNLSIVVVLCSMKESRYEVVESMR